MLATFWFLALGLSDPWANISGETYRDIRRSTNGGVFGEDSGDQERSSPSPIAYF